MKKLLIAAAIAAPLALSLGTGGHLAGPQVVSAEQPHHGCDTKKATCFHKDTGQKKTGQHPSKHRGNN